LKTLIRLSNKTCASLLMSGVDVLMSGIDVCMSGIDVLMSGIDLWMCVIDGRMCGIGSSSTPQGVILDPTGSHFLPPVRSINASYGPATRSNVLVTSFY